MSDQTSNELTLVNLLRVLARKKWSFALLAVFFGALMVAYAFISTPRYTIATKLVLRSTAEQAGGLQSLLGQFGGLASLAGVSLGGSGDQEESLAWIRSRAFAERFIINNNLMPALFSKAWDSRRASWRAEIAPDDIPTLDDAYNVFDRQIRRVNQDQKTGIVTLEVVWKDRVRAAQWADAMVEQANRELRARALKESDESLRFLDAERQKTNVVEMQQAIYRLMEAQVKRKLLANTRPDYAFTVIDPAAIPDADRYTSPKRKILILLALPFGLVAAACLLLGWYQLVSLRTLLR